MLASDELRSPQEGADRNVTDPVRTVRVLDFMEATWLSGPAKNLINFANLVSQSNHSPLRVEIAVVVFHRGKEPVDNEFTLACREAGLRLHVIHERFAFDPAIVRAIRRLIAAQSPDILQTHSVKSHFLIRLIKAYRQRPWIAFHHGYTWTNLKVLAYNQLDRWSLLASSKVLTVCGPFASALERFGIQRERIEIRHNSVSPFVPATEEAVRDLRQTLRISPGTPLLLNVARLSREKGQAELIKALAVLHHQGGERMPRLVFVGDGPDRLSLERLAAARGVADSVTFVGHQSVVAPYYSVADMMVLPSLTEGSPNALLEAMAAGLPIVATATGGVPEIVANTGSALLVQPHDHLALARAIGQVLGSETTRQQLSTAARHTAAAYSPQSYCDFMLSLYKDCLAQAAACKRTDKNHTKSSRAAIQNKAVLTD